MAITNVLAVVPVIDLDVALAWYARLFGRPADRLPMDGLAEWQLTETGGLQVFQVAEGAGGASVTLAVDDLERHVADLASRDIVDSGITRGDTASFATVTDPEGNTITFAEPRS